MYTIKQLDKIRTQDIFVSMNGPIYIWNLDGDISRLNTRANGFSLLGDKIITQDARYISVWNLQGDCEKQCANFVNPILYEGLVFGCLFDDTKVRVFDPLTEESIIILEGHKTIIRKIRITRYIIITFVYDSTVRVYDRSTGKCIIHFPLETPLQVEIINDTQMIVVNKSRVSICNYQSGQILPFMNIETVCTISKGIIMGDEKGTLHKYIYKIYFTYVK